MNNLDLPYGEGTSVYLKNCQKCSVETIKGDLTKKYICPKCCKTYYCDQLEEMGYKPFVLEDIFGKGFFNSGNRGGNPSLLNEYECVGCGSVKNLIRKIDIEEPVYCKPCLNNLMTECGNDRKTE